MARVHTRRETAQQCERRWSRPEDHDLRNPISAVQMGAALLNDGELSQSQRRTVERITRATERATGLLGDLLDFTTARLGGGIRVNTVAMSLHDVIAETLEELRLANPGREIRQTRTGDGQCRGDGARLAQVVGNLVGNAITYGDPLLPIIVMTTSGERCSVAVHNWGEPIPLELQAKLFEPMTRGSDGSANRARSVGLGLYIVREIARALGGDATVTSNPADGTTFLVSWPG
jgi:sigma-B regulation protein RsbU (phosphoserine phosphatase)